MIRSCASTLLVVGVLSGLVACDNVATRPLDVLKLNACPTGTQDVNTPIALSFSTPLLPSSVSLGNIVVSDAVTGVEIPGAVTLDASGSAVRFTPSAPLPFGHRLRIRIQNLLSAGTHTQIPVTLCELTTAPPPITDTSWVFLPSAGGDILDGVSVISPDSGFVMNQLGVLYKRAGSGDFTVVDHSPYLFAGFDVNFVSPQIGFAAWQNFRTRQSVILETKDGGLTFDSLTSVNFYITQRLYFRPTTDTTKLFGVIGGGNTTTANFYKWHPESHSLTVFTNSTTGYPNDVDFAAHDTTLGAAVTNGIRVGSFDERGKVLTSADGGSTWAEVPGLTATSRTQTYFGVAVRGNGQVYVAGGSGYFARLTPTGGGNYSVTPLLVNAVTNPDTTNPLALYFSDVQFAPDNDQLGWVIGAQETGIVNGIPSYRGLIFVTHDGGQTWVREGVRTAHNYGAEFPRLNRLSVASSTAAWAVGDGGTVIKFQP